MILSLNLLGWQLKAQSLQQNQESKKKERVEPIPYGDMENWFVREITESRIIGGAKKILYEIAPSDTLKGNIPYSNRGGSNWGNSNVMAKVAGIVKTNVSVFPERRDNGWCVRMETRMEKVKVLGIVDIEVVAAGSLFLGKIHEPIRGVKNPQSMLLSGIPFTKRPKAVRFDYKAKVMPENWRVYSPGLGRKSKIPGQDSLAVILILQKRWEDKQGNVYGKRVGTMIERYSESTNGWVNNATYPILYGNITSHPSYKNYMHIQDENRYTVNSKGESVPIKEIGWAEADETPTHIILQFVSSHGGAYTGSIGNTLWIDNVKLVY